LKDEMEEEATRQLWVHLRKLSSISSRIPVEADQENTYYARHAANLYPGKLQFAKPATALGNPIIHIKVPFFLPPDEQEWRFREYHDTLFDNPTGYQSYSSDADDVEDVDKADSLGQRAAYRFRVGRMLAPICQLHKLHLKSINIEFVAAENVVAKIIDDPKLEQTIPDGKGLHTTVLGQLVETYIEKLREQCLHLPNVMIDTGEDWAYNTFTINIAWNFGLQKEAWAIGLQEEAITQGNHGPRLQTVMRCGAVLVDMLFAMDRRNGGAVIEIDLKGYARKEVTELKERLQRFREMFEIGYDAYIGIDHATQAIRELRKLMHKIGIAEEEEESNIAEEDEWLERARRETMERNRRDNMERERRQREEGQEREREEVEEEERAEGEAQDQLETS
ncbi:hypothetical protein N0V94_006105, partial [Neodidymelliopsis sp. IMI 364377]